MSPSEPFDGLPFDLTDDFDFDPLEDLPSYLTDDFDPLESRPPRARGANEGAFPIIHFSEDPEVEGDPLVERYERVNGLDYDSRNRIDLLKRELLEAWVPNHSPSGCWDADGWVIDEEGRDGQPLLLVPVYGTDGLLAVRAVPIHSGWLPEAGDAAADDEGLPSLLDLDDLHVAPSWPTYDDLLGDDEDDCGATDEGPLDLGGSWVEAHPGAGLVDADIPAPFALGMFEADVVFAVRSPVVAAVLNRRGVRACALVCPAETLGSADAVRQLVELGALRERGRPRGTLVLVDADDELSRDGAGLLRSFFAEVIEVQGWDHGASEEGDALLRVPPTPGLRKKLLAAARSLGRRRTERSVRLPDDIGEDDAGGDDDANWFVGLDKIAATPGQAVDWVVPGLAAVGSITDLMGEPKAGKTTLIFDAARAVAGGTDFLGRPCPQGTVLIVTEQTRTSLAATLDQMDWVPGPGVRVVTFDDHSGTPFDEVVRRVRREVRATGARLVVFDTLPAVSRMGGEVVAAGPVRDVFTRLRSVSVLGAAVVAVRHTTKASSGRDKPIMSAGAGSYAFAAEADHVVRYTLVGDRGGLRRVETVGRLGPPETFDVDRTEGGEFVRLGMDVGAEPVPSKRKKPRTEVQEEAVLAVLGAATDGPLSVREVVDRCRSAGRRRAKDGAVRRALDRLVGRGEVTKDTSGKPHRYAVPDPEGGPPSSDYRSDDEDAK